MARVTIEDCIEVVPNIFELVVLSAKRARDLYAGAEQLVACNDKEPVVALREIAADVLDLDSIRASIVKDIMSGKSYDNNQGGLSSFDDIFSDIENEEEEIKSAKARKAQNNIIQGNIFADQNLDVED